MITDKPDNYEVAAGSSATFRCNAHADDSLHLEIIWLNDGEPIDFENQPRFRMTNDYSLLISDTTELDSGEYTCIARTAIDEARAQATLTVQGRFRSKMVGFREFVRGCFIITYLYQLFFSLTKFLVGPNVCVN